VLLARALAHTAQFMKKFLFGFVQTMADAG
jgi:hypothetical protein